MLRRLATLVLAVPLFLNGMWMVCSDGSAAGSAGKQAVASNTGDAVPICDGKICPVQKTPSSGSICLFTANGSGSGIAAVMFAVTVPPACETLARSITVTDVLIEQPLSYANPAPEGSTPPPKA